MTYHFNQCSDCGIDLPTSKYKRTEKKRCKSCAKKKISNFRKIETVDFKASKYCPIEQSRTAFSFKILPLLLLGACSSLHNQDIIIEKQAYMMSRQEVITAIEDCKSAKLRPIIFYGRRKVMDKPIPFIVDVTCAPKSN
jgi:hypothetical protein